MQDPTGQQAPCHTGEENIIKMKIKLFLPGLRTEKKGKLMAKEISFEYMVRNLINKKNPDTNKIYTKAEISKILGANESYLGEWFLMIANLNQKKIEEEGRIATDDELIAAYKLLYGEKIVIATPFGLLYKDARAQTSETKIGEMDSEEFTALMNKILGK